MYFKIFFTCILLFAHITQAASDVYIIKNIKISANNKVASSARSEAVENGQLRAFTGLVKLHYPDALSKIKSIDKEDILSLVESFELSNERRSATRYMAVLRVRFSRSHVDQLMDSMGASFTEASITKRPIESDKIDNSVNNEIEIPQAVVPINGSSIAQEDSQPQVVLNPTLVTLVIPVFIEDNQEYWLDEDKNLWFKFWKNKLANENSAKFVLPLGDLEDLILLNKKITQKNLIDLAPLFDKYNVNNIAVYTLKDSGDGNGHLSSLSVEYINKFYYSWQHHKFISFAAEDTNNLLTKSYEMSSAFDFSDNKYQDNDVNFQEIKPYKIEIEFHIEKISDWISFKNLLSDIRYISEIKLDKMTIKQYNFSCVANISIENLKELFKKYNYLLEEQDGKFNLLKDYSHE